MLAFLALTGFALGQRGAAFIPSWSGLADKYAYKHLESADVANVSITDMGTSTETRFTYRGTPGDTVHAVLVEPKSSKPVPVVVLLHGLGGSAQEIGASAGQRLLADGIAYAAIDAPGHGQRTSDQDQKVMQEIAVAVLSNKGDLLKSMVANDDPQHLIFKFLDRATREGILDDRHLIDYLMSRPDIDYHHVGLIGVSLGSIMGAILGSVDNRIKAMILMVGGDPVFPLIPSMTADVRNSAIATSCSLYAPHFKGPVRMIAASKDLIMPRSATDRLYSAFSAGSKSISWYNSDHFLPPLAFEEADQWISDRMK